MSVTVRMRHVRHLNWCSGRTRDWFASKGLSWSDFLEHGISSDILEATGDHLALEAVAVARKEAEGG